MAITKLTVPRFPSWPPGEWCDVDAYGAHVVLGEMIKPGRLMLYTVDGDTLIPEGALDLGRWGLFLRIALEGGGRVAAIAQDGRDPQPGTNGYPAILVIHDGERIFEVHGCPPAFGEGCVEVVGKPGGGWWVWVQTSKFTFWRADLSPAGAIDGREFQVPLPEGTSQGFTQGNSDGTIRFLDTWRNTTPGMVIPNDAAGLTVGQNTTGRDRLVGTIGQGLFTVHRGTAFTPHVVLAPAGWIVCARTAEGPALLRLQPPFTLEAAEPPPGPELPSNPPPVDPPKEEPPVEIPDHFAVVKNVSDEHPALLAANSPESMTELLWRIADELHRNFDGRWGLLQKSAGENHTTIGGLMVGVDSLAFKGSDQIVDIFRAAYDGPGQGGLTWGIDDRRPSNTWVAPPVFAASSPETPMPGEPGTPTPTQPPPATSGEVVDLLKTIAARVVHLEATVTEATMTLVDKANQMVNKVDDLQRDVQSVRAIGELVKAQIDAGIKVRLR